MADILRHWRGGGGGYAMMLRKRVVALTFVLIAAVCVVTGITADEILSRGLRQFSLGNWDESAEFLKRFQETWPHHQKAHEARGWQLIAETRALGDDRTEITQQRRRDLVSAFGDLERDLPASMLPDVEVALFHLKWYLAPRSTKPWTHVPSMKAPKLSHALDRGWIPGPSDHPIETLVWIASWTNAHGRSAPPLLKGRLAWYRAKALWALWTSPLAAQAREDQLRGLGCWPVHEALVGEIRKAFDYGNADVRRHTAIMGLSLDRLRPRVVPRTQVEIFQAFLDARGIHLQEAWTPR